MPAGDRILIIDDTPSNVRLLERILAMEGWANVRSTTDSRHIIALVESFRPDLILLDLNMPHVDGYAVLAALRDWAGPGTAPAVIVLTGDVTVPTMRRAFEAGAAAVLTKPFERVELLARVRSVLLAVARANDPAAQRAPAA